MRGYFEPNEAEREQGFKVPTEAHRAAARLVASGHVRVILTTNFDRLSERALEEVGIVPTVVSSPDQLQGLPPLLQVGCLILKLHGDYLDSRIKNTPEELARYDKRLNRLLDRILDEFGLIICGWSAQWDQALRSALGRCRSNRFTTYWTHKGPLDDEAMKLIALRRAQSIPIVDADSFFESLVGRIQALEEYDRPHPLSVRMMVETVKGYLVDTRHRIRLRDLVSRETEETYEKLFSPDRFPLAKISVNGKEVLERLRQYEAITERLQAAMMTGAAWSEQQQLDIWRKCIARISVPPQLTSDYNPVWKGLRKYPALHLMYACGLAALAEERLDSLYALMFAQVLDENSGRQLPLLLSLHLMRDINRDVLNKALEKNWQLPASEYLFVNLRETLRTHFPTDNAYQYAFDLFEYLWALAYMDMDQAQSGWPPLGRFTYSGTLSKIRQEIKDQGKSWLPLREGFFGGSLERLAVAEMAIAGPIHQLGFR